MENEKEKPVVELLGSDGNAMMVIAKCRRALKASGYTKEQIEEFSKEAMSGDYDHVLQTAMEWCEVE